MERLLEGAGVPGGARAAEAGRRVPALHPVAARDHLPALPRADAVDAGGAASCRTRTIRAWPAAPAPCRAARRCTRCRSPTTRPAVSSGPRTTSRLLPIEVASASYFSFAPDLPLNALPFAPADQGRPAHPAEDDGRSEVRADDVRSPVLLPRRARRRHEQAARAVPRHRAGRAGAAGRRPAQDVTLLPPSAIQPVGFTDQEALLPVTVRSFQGYRLLQEYFSFPAALSVLRAHRAGAERRAACRATSSSWWCWSGAAIRRSRASSTSSNLQLFCTPAVNLFEKPRVDRIHVSDSTYEFHVVADRTRPLDFEIYQVTVGRRARRGRRQRAGVPAVLLGGRAPTSRHPAVGVLHDAAASRGSCRRTRGGAARDRATSAARSSCRSSTPTQAPYSARPAPALDAGAVHQSRPGAADADRARPDRLLAEHRRAGHERAGDQRSEPAVFGGGRRRDRVARDQPPVAQLSVAGECHRAAGRGRAPRLLELYATTADVERAAADRGHPIGAASAGSCAGCRARGPIAFGRGLEITVDVDEMAFEGGSAFLLGAVLDRYFARYVSINSVTETVLRSQSRGEINRWAPNWGTRPTL